VQIAAPPRRAAVPAHEPAADHALIIRLVAGDASAAAAFLHRAIPPLTAAIAKMEPQQDGQHAALLYVLAALKDETYQRLQAFDGRASLGSFLALLARELLARRAVDRLLADPENGWTRFKRIFDQDIQIRIAKRFPFDAGTGRWDDIYQDICVKLVESNCRRLRDYGGKGSFVGFILKVVQNLLADELRRDIPRRRLPAAIERMPPIAQEIYKAVVWDGCPLEIPRLSALLRGRLADAASETDLRAALAQVTEVIPTLHAAPPAKPKIVSLDGAPAAIEGEFAVSYALTPEEQLLLAEEENTRETLMARIKAAAQSLSDEERLYLQLAFGAEPMPRRKIAELMHCPVEDVDRLKKKIQRWFAAMREAHENGDSQLSLTK
jgi:RNA polymerase primary sigma factor